MGVLKEGVHMSWADVRACSRYIRDHGAKQFMHTWRRTADDGRKDEFLYGDEVEYALVRVDHGKREVRLQLRAAEVLEELRGGEVAAARSGCGSAAWHVEYGAWMVESTPAGPYVGNARSLLQVEESMRLRRARLLAALRPDEIAPTMVTFPLLGVGDDFYRPRVAATRGPTSVPDHCICKHPRFLAMTGSLRQRRGHLEEISARVFPDAHTSETSVEMDAMAYGFGCCCLQVTLQASDAEESRHLYDQLAPLAPIMLALTSATPILRGRLVDSDARWATISAAVDDRRPEEMGAPGEGARADPRMAGGGVRRMSKSRYDSISTYISRPANASASRTRRLNNVACEVDEATFAALQVEGLEEPVARHVAHLLARDPLIAFHGAVEEVDDSNSMEHYESLNTTNWQTMRWKPPPASSEGGPHIGWRTEFRSMEVQLTDFENAAFTAFVVLLSRAILAFRLDFLAPLSKVDENMARAQRVDAVNTQKFWFRSDVEPSGEPDDHCDEMTMSDIVGGKGAFLGLVPLCYAYLEHIGCDAESFRRIDAYLILIKRRARGELLTPASWMRRVVQEHPEYKRDSVVTQGIAYDLLRACDEIGRGQQACPCLLGGVEVEPIVAEGAFGTQLRTEPQDPAGLLRRFSKRVSSDDSLDSFDSTDASCTSGGKDGMSPVLGLPLDRKQVTTEGDV
mmetsp:Transcript_4847/g.14099  ORF Transcript_4847/g.14099 Transcript_4847/m.14099 type:complete len:684 (+) Transcript_4847:97-2148(+)